MSMLLIKLAIRLVVFTLVFWIAAKRHSKIKVNSRLALPLVASVFALLNAALYWMLKPMINIASLGAVTFVMPLIVNGALLYATLRIVRRRPKLVKEGQPVAKPKPPLLHIDGIIAMVFMALVLTAAHGVLWFALEFIPRSV